MMNFGTFSTRGSLRSATRHPSAGFNKMCPRWGQNLQQRLKNNRNDLHRQPNGGKTSIVRKFSTRFLIVQPTVSQKNKTTIKLLSLCRQRQIGQIGWESRNG